jgi:hypothetical protein
VKFGRQEQWGGPPCPPSRPSLKQLVARSRACAWRARRPAPLSNFKNMRSFGHNTASENGNKSDAENRHPEPPAKDLPKLAARFGICPSCSLPGRGQIAKGRREILRRWHSAGWTPTTQPATPRLRARGNVGAGNPDRGRQRGQCYADRSLTFAARIF